MTAPSVPWLAATRPLCPVPWEGNSIVLASGEVMFCCFSDAVVGNVREQPFEQVWNGPAMQRIRRALARGVLPSECRSVSCPFFRGDQRHYLIERRDGAHRHGDLPVVQRIAAERLAGSALIVPERVRRGERLSASARIAYAGGDECADVYVCWQRPDGSLQFLPGGDDFPIPFALEQPLREAGASVVWDVAVDERFAPGLHTLWLACFVPGSDPSLPNHLYWSTRASFLVDA